MNAIKENEIIRPQTEPEYYDYMLDEYEYSEAMRYEMEELLNTIYDLCEISSVSTSTKSFQ